MSATDGVLESFIETALGEVRGFGDREAIASWDRRRTEGGARIIDDTLRDALDERTWSVVQQAVSDRLYASGLERSILVAGYGYVLAEEVLWTIGRTQAESSIASLEIGALWNLLIAFFDELCDEFGWLRSSLPGRFDVPLLRAALDSPDGRRIRATPDDPLLLAFVLQVGDAVFTRYGAAAKRWPHAHHLWFRRAVETAYCAELKTAEVRFSDIGDPEEFRRFSRDSSSLPIQALGFLAVACAGEPAAWSRLARPIALLGDVLWLADDLVDVELDIENDRWNAVLFEAKDRYGAAFLDEMRLLPPEERITRLQERGVVHALGERVLRTLHAAVRALERAYGPTSPLATGLVTAVAAFSLGALARRRGTPATPPTEKPGAIA